MGKSYTEISRVKKKVLVFGGFGFIGGNLVEQLGGKYKLITPSRQDIDLTKNANLSNDIDVVINCVNSNDNLDVFLNITRFYSGRLIHLGSGAEYDKSLPIKNIKEEDFGKRRPKDKYGLGKYYISEKIDWLPNIVCLRPFGVFGKYEDIRRRFISKALLDNMAGRKITIYKNVKLSYIWVNDLIKIIDYFIVNKPKHRFYNIGGHKLTLTSIAKKIGKYEILESGMGNEYTCNDDRVQKETKIKYTPFSQSLKFLRNYYEKISTIR